MARPRRFKPPTQVLQPPLFEIALPWKQYREVVRKQLMDHGSTEWAGGLSPDEADRELTSWDELVEATRYVRLDESRLGSLSPAQRRQLLPYLRADIEVVRRRASGDRRYRQKLLDIDEADPEARQKLEAACSAYFGPNAAMSQGVAPTTWAKGLISSGGLVFRGFGSPRCTRTIRTVLREYYHLKLDDQGRAGCTNASLKKALTAKELRAARKRWSVETAP